MPASPGPKTEILPIQGMADWEQRLARHEAFWANAVHDRPVAVIQLPQPCPARYRVAEKCFETLRERWMDADYMAAKALEQIMSTIYLGDALPSVCPNLGPEVFSAFFGQELEFGEATSWSVPVLHEWSKTDELQFSDSNFYWKKILELTDAMLALSEGRYYVGLTDLHPGGDAIAAFRDPQTLNVDMIDHVEEVKGLLERINRIFFKVMDFYYAKLHAAGHLTTCWIGMFSQRKFYVPSNDFSCMISKSMFDEVFLPGIREECRHLDVSIYHLDGPGALRHLDSLLSIPELNAIQWVYGAGNGKATDWLHVYKKCQDAGKGVQLHIHVSELETILENLRPEGLWLGISGIKNPGEARDILRRLKRKA